MLKKVSSRARKSAAKAGRIPKNVDEYLASVPGNMRPALEKLRATVRSAMPREATETISYRILAFKHERVMVWIAAFSNHCSLFPGAAILEAFKEELKNYPTSKGTVRFPTSQPLPTGLIRKLVKARVAENQTKK